MGMDGEPVVGLWRRMRVRGFEPCRYECTTPNHPALSLGEEGKLGF